MKKCPTCEKTFEDNLKFCQADGTPLVEDKPADDPYKTMVANKADFQIPPKEEPKSAPEEPKAPEVEKAPEVTKAPEEPKVPEVPKAPEVAKAPEEPKDTTEPVAVSEEKAPASDKPDILEVPEEAEFDPMKTMVAGGKNTAGNIEVDAKDLPKEEPKAEKAEAKKEPEPKADKVVPAPPKFEEPELSAPDMTGALSEPLEVKTPEKVEVDTPPPTPFDSKPKKEKTMPAEKPKKDVPSAPIPSPFDKSMPPGYAPPSTPPFDPTEPVKAEKVASSAQKADKANVTSSASAPIEKKPPSGVSKSNVVSESTGEGDNKTLAIVSMVCGILSMTLCCGIGILMGPAGLITGFIARGKISEDPKEYGGGMFALIGMITGVIGTIVFIALVILRLFSGVLLGLV